MKQIIALLLVLTSSVLLFGGNIEIISCQLITVGIPHVSEELTVNITYKTENVNENIILPGNTIQLLAFKENKTNYITNVDISGFSGELSTQDKDIVADSFTFKLPSLPNGYDKIEVSLRLTTNSFYPESNRAFSGKVEVDPTEETLPVELSTFTSILSTNNNTISVAWKTASESEMLGYNIFRSENSDLNSAIRVNPTLIIAENSTTGSRYSIIDTEIETNTTYYYWLEIIHLDNLSEFFGHIETRVDFNDDTEEISIPQLTKFRSIYPNPFNPSTSINFYLAKDEKVIINVYNSKGQFIKQIVNSIYNVGSHNVTWDGKDSRGTICASDLYLFKMITTSKNEVIKGILLK